MKSIIRIQCNKKINDISSIRYSSGSSDSIITQSLILQPTEIGFIREFFMNNSISYAFENLYQVLNITGFPLVTSIGLVVLTLRVVSLPVYVLSEKLVAKRVKMDELINTTIIERAAKEYQIDIYRLSLPAGTGNNKIPVLKTTDEALLRALSQMAAKESKHLMSKEGVGIPRILLLSFWLYTKY